MKLKMADVKPVIGRVINPFVGRYLERLYYSKMYPKWADILKRDFNRWESAHANVKNGPKVLLATSVGGLIPMAILESTLAVALTLRGAEVHILLCDETLPACMLAEIGQFPSPKEFAQYGPSKRLCGRCFVPAMKMFKSLGLPLHRYSNYITEEEFQKASVLSSELAIDQIGKYRLDDLAVGEHALAGALRFFARGTLEGVPYGEPILRRYFFASLLTAYMARRLLITHKFLSACFHHGIYVPQGLIGEVARQQNVRVVNWNPAYRKRRFIFSHHDTYHHTLLSEPTAHWESLPWTAKMESDTLDYLKSRWKGTYDWIWFHEKPQEDLSVIAKELCLDFSKPCIGLLTNVMWDAQLHYRATAFSNMLEWVLETIRYFSRRPDLQLVIRVHPAEVRGTIPSRQPIIDEVKRTFPKLPKNVFIIPPESPISTYAVMLRCNAVIIYGTKTGVELTSYGVPVIVAGEAWIRNKGVTLEASSPSEYFTLLDQLPLKEQMNVAMIQRACKYAYHFFFRRMIPFPFMVPTSSWPPYKVELSSIDDLLPGQSVGLDVVCNGILHGDAFIYPAELCSEILNEE